MNAEAMRTRNLGKYDQAIADLTKVIEARPKDPEAYRQRAYEDPIDEQLRQSGSRFQQGGRTEAQRHRCQIAA